MAITKLPDGCLSADAVEDDELYTVLHGWGRLPHNEKHFVDTTECIGGIMRNVPGTTCRYWLKGTRPDGKPTVGRVYVKVLPNTATEREYVLATGIQPMSAENLAAQITSVDLSTIYKALGPQRTLELAQELKKLVETGPAKSTKA